ncbi:hypothetical protein BDW67DRAFT_155051 [Aspergillus spinulosporus]
MFRFHFRLFWSTLALVGEGQGAVGTLDLDTSRPNMAIFPSRSFSAQLLCRIQPPTVGVQASEATRGLERQYVIRLEHLMPLLRWQICPRFPVARDNDLVQS